MKKSGKMCAKIAEMPLIFCHFGYSEYLVNTLICARQTNPGRRLIFLGDDQNHLIAQAAGWEHHNFADFRSSQHDGFDRHYKVVGGRTVHKNAQGRNRIWLRFIFERWMHIHGFCADQGITRFWHFDSDTMVLRDLSEYEPRLAMFDYTTQCNGTCLNGVVSWPVLDEFAKHMVKRFSDDSLQETFLKENAHLGEDAYYNEMVCFDDYTKTSKFKGTRLMFALLDEIFDDVICQEHGFDMTTVRTGERMKNVYLSNGRLCGQVDGKEVKFATLNLSWVRAPIFRWVRRALAGDQTRLQDYALPARLAFVLNWWDRTFRRF